MLKNILIIVLIVLLLNNFWANPCYAAEAQHWAVTGVDTIVDLLTGAVGTLVAILTLPLRIFAILAGYAINALTAVIAYVDDATTGNSKQLFITPYDIFFNKARLFEINFFDIPNDGSIASEIRSSVAGWYYVMRTLAAAILLVILIYVGIRMAISTIASDRAMYKRMIVDWIASLALIFVLQYIMIFTISANDAIVKSISLIVDSEEISNVYHNIAGMAIPNELSLKAIKAIISLDSIAATVIFCMLVWQTLGLVFSYFNRMLKLAFLIIISPLISLTYSIDKMGDGKAQALGTWLKEFVFTVLIQPFHCIIYMCFIDAAFDLLVKKNGIDGITDGSGALAASIIAILCVKFTKEGEKIVRKIFAFKDDNSGTSLAGGMAAASIALSQAKNFGKTTRKAVNGVKSFGKGFSEIRRNAVIEATAMKALITSKDGDKTFSEYKEEASIKQNKKEADKALKKLENAPKEFKVASEEFNKQVRDEMERVKDLNPGISHAEAKQVARRKVAQKLKKTNGTRRGRTISRAKGQVNKLSEKFGKTKVGTAMNTVGEAISEIRNSETGKMVSDYIRASANAGVGFMVGSGTYGTSGNVATAITAGIAAGSGMKEFMTGSKETLSKGIVQNMKALGVKNAGEGRAIMKAVQIDAEKYDGSDKTNETVKELIDDILKSLPDNKKSEHSDIRNKIASTLDSPLTSPTAISRILGKMEDKSGKKLLDTKQGQALIDYSNRKAIYTQINNAEAAGISQYDLMESLDKKFMTVGSSETPSEAIVNSVINGSSDTDTKKKEFDDFKNDKNDKSITDRITEAESKLVTRDAIDKKADLDAYKKADEELKEMEEEIAKRLEVLDRDFEKAIAEQYEISAEYDMDSSEYKIAMEKAEKLKIEQAEILAKKMAEKRSVLEALGANLGKEYQRKLDEAIKSLERLGDSTRADKFRIIHKELTENLNIMENDKEKE